MSDINANPFKSYNFFKEMDCNSVHKLKNWASAKIAVKEQAVNPEPAKAFNMFRNSNFGSGWSGLG